MPAQVACPVCARPVPWNESSRWRPFCSERCRLIDLGDWASERHVIAGETPQSSDESAASSPRDSDDPRH